ncbi:methyl-accepting chemotaxis protein-1 (serine sensor receptor) [Paraburkholderia eburnea]|uniref:Methyl-accepting chemotaxis protein-1 (Serine sensor receptor) n=1 Tax=Paraburkholderia eburnea TaxID=1189126 RepID=A0A2S4MJF9_9BURK|nr:methyl-accepting chemotaxis protein [Paraburkholderia eburnea]POR54765.1 methyl-accepting chemotaxis protein-1 (serine sensor receptor) [Paraburkholderia eburnea]PRZ24635.1 methyl-accepting chemotaxis protein-1 (serine sensor receptor) [Paraburkholderia eburnea]
MTIKLKLQIVMLVTLLAIGAGVAATVAGFNAVASANADKDRRALEVRSMTEIKGSMLSTVELDPTADDTKKIFATAEQNINRWTDTLMSTFVNPVYQQKFRAVRQQWDAYDQKSHQLFDLASHDAKSANDQVAAVYHSDFQPMNASVQALTDSLSSLEQMSSEQAASISRISQISVTVVLAMVMVLVIGCVFILSRSIVRSLTGIQGTLQAASETLDLGLRVRLESKDEIGQTGVAFNHLMDRVSSVMTTVHNAVASVNTASREISTGNIDLSSRTEEQAASLEETAASMEELTGTVRQNAENAGQAMALASNASDIARRGNEVVSQVVDTMHRISSSSAKIADITGMIEGIAFQTNILALNAAVEAARAGEQGRGFAVVAGEVRNLAQRASTAAKEIKELIEESVATSAQGSELAARAGHTMGDVIGAVSRVTDIMSEIAAASDEQSKGIDQIGQAVSQMDQMTQQNAALVEQAAAAAQSMQDQAGRLRAVVDEFKFSGSQQTAARPVVALSTPTRASAVQLKKSVAAPKVVPGLKRPVRPLATEAGELSIASNDEWTTF